MEGWIKLHRKLLDWEWSMDIKTWFVFTKFLLFASHNNHKWRGVALNPGQFPFGYESFSKKIGISVKSMRTCVNRLKSTNELAIESSSQGSVITILNWEKYQSGADERADEGQTKGKRRALTKNGKNGKNGKNIYINDFDYEAIYKKYPSNAGKKKGMVKLKEIIKTEDQYNLFSKAVDNYLKHLLDESWKKPMNWSTFVNNYEDWIEVKSLEEEYIFTEWDEKDKTRIFEGCNE